MTDAAEDRPDQPADHLAAGAAPDTLKDSRHPWARFWAKGIDTGIFSLLISIPVAMTGIEGGAADVLAWLMFVPLFCLAEGALIARTTGTPGKAVFGIAVTAGDGAKLDLKTSIKRSFGSLLWGLALAVPFLSLAAMAWFGYRDYTLKGVTRWDRDTGVAYIAKPTGKSWIILCIILLVLFVLIFMITAASMAA